MKVLLVDDHALFREGVALLLRPLVNEPLEISEAGSCEQALALLAAQPQIDGGPPMDLILMDLGLPGISGLDGIALLRDRYPEVPVVALSSNDDKQSVMHALDAGAMGFIPKSSSSPILIQALRLVMAKGIYLPPAVFLGRHDLTESKPNSMVTTPEAREPTKTAQELGLSPRQVQVLHLLLQGKSAKLICRELDLSASTVKAHTSSVLRALNVTTRTQAVLAASRLGLRFDQQAS